MGNSCNLSLVAKEQTIARITRLPSWYCHNEIYCSKLHLVAEFGCRNRVDDEKHRPVHHCTHGGGLLGCGKEYISTLQRRTATTSLG